MDKKLKEAVDKEDWYSAHQIYLALAQKHQRGKRQCELMQVLTEGTINLARANQVNSTVQLAEKLVEAVNEADAKEWLPEVFKALHEMEPSSAITFGNALVEKLPNVASALCKSAMYSGCEEAGRYALLSKEQGLVKTLGEEYPEDAWARLVVRCLISKNFQAASMLISLKISGLEGRKTIDDPSGTLPYFTAITDKSVVNFCELLFIACQRKCDKGMLHDLLREFKEEAKMIPEDWIKALEKAYWTPVQTQEAPMNPLAQMMQNFMRPPPTSTGSSSAPGRGRIGEDLD